MGKCIVLVGGIASGKTTLAKELEGRGFRRIVTYTTRSIRNGEKDGVDYHFISKDEFHKKYNEGFFAEVTEYSDGSYGSARDAYNAPDDTVVILNPQGVMHLKLRESAFIVHLDLKEDVLIWRAKERGDSIEKIGRRILDDARYFEWMLQAKTPDMVIKFNMSVEAMADIIISTMDICGSSEKEAAASKE